MVREEINFLAERRGIVKSFRAGSRASAFIFGGLLGLAAVTAGAAFAADDESTARIVDYFRRKQNLPPGVQVTVKEIKDSKIDGAMSATIEVSMGGRTQEVDIVMSKDGRYVAFASVEDVTSDPFAEIAKKIKTDGQPTKGPKSAKVTLVEYSDFQCPYCARAHTTLQEVLKEYGDKVQVVYKNFPLNFHKWAEPAAIAGECVYDQRPDAFWKLYDYYFEHQRDLTPENVKEKTLEALKDTKLNMDKFNECYDGKKTLERVQADMTEGQQVGVTGTPAFLINGRKISGAQPAAQFKAIIDDELSRAEKKG
jgi:protein-disulfide isomerase